MGTRAADAVHRNARRPQCTERRCTACGQCTVCAWPLVRRSEERGVVAQPVAQQQRRVLCRTWCTRSAVHLVERCTVRECTRCGAGRVSLLKRKSSAIADERARARDKGATRTQADPSLGRSGTPTPHTAHATRHDPEPLSRKEGGRMMTCMQPTQISGTWEPAPLGRLEPNGNI